MTAGGWLSCELNGGANSTIIKVMLNVKQLVKSPKFAHLIIGDVPVNEQGTLYLNKSNLELTLIIFLVLLLAFLLFIVAVAIRGQMTKKIVKCACEHAAPNVTSESAPKFSFFDDHIF